MDLPSRRAILLGIGAGLMGLAAAETVRRVWPGDAAPGFRVLDAESVVICEILAARFIGPRHSLARVVEEVDKTLDALPEVGDLWRRLPRILETSTLADGHFAPFSELSPEEQEAVLWNWASSSILERRQIFHGLRDLIVSHFYFQPASWPDIRYEGPWVGRLDLPVHEPRFPVEVEG